MIARKKLLTVEMGVRMLDMARVAMQMAVQTLRITIALFHATELPHRDRRAPS